MIRVVVTGSECTGKTTLTAGLAARYETVWAPEYARDFVESKGAELVAEDVEAIARGQIDLEEELAGKATRLLFQDTDLLSTVVYAHHYYGDCPSWIEHALLERAPDLYLLAGIDVPWQADGLHRDRGDRREEMQALFSNALLTRGFPFVELEGSAPHRLASGTAAVDTLLAGSTARP